MKAEIVCNNTLGDNLAYDCKFKELLCLLKGACNSVNPRRKGRERVKLFIGTPKPTVYYAVYYLLFQAAVKTLSHRRQAGNKQVLAFPAVKYNSEMTL